MKKSDLKELIREEIHKVLSEKLDSRYPLKLRSSEYNGETRYTATGEETKGDKFFLSGFWAIKGNKDHEYLIRDLDKGEDEMVAVSKEEFENYLNNFIIK